MSKVTISEPKLFVDEFKRYYLDRGFGSMTKAELESLFFHLLREYGSIKDKRNFEISIDLQIPESKVRRLAYEAELRFGKHDYSKAELVEILKDSYVNYLDDKRVQFSIEDKFKQSCLSAKLKSLRHYSDTSFNPEIVTLSTDALYDLLLDYDEEAAVLFDKECKERKDKDSHPIQTAISCGSDIVTIISAFITGVNGVKALVESIKW